MITDPWPKTTPWIEELEQEFEDTVFLTVSTYIFNPKVRIFTQKVDCDALPNLVHHEKVKVVPTFYFFRKNRHVSYSKMPYHVCSIKLRSKNRRQRQKLQNPSFNPYF